MEYTQRLAQCPLDAGHADWAGIFLSELLYAHNPAIVQAARDALELTGALVNLPVWVIDRVERAAAEAGIVDVPLF